MRSHHAPTRHLLERFSFRDLRYRSGRAIWVFERGRTPRQTRNLAGESVEHGYFGGAADGTAEEVIDERLNTEYELPFNELLPLIDGDVYVFDSLEIRRTCARYLSNLFQRCRARRTGADSLFDKINAGYRDIANSKCELLVYAAKLSCIARRPIDIGELRAALYNQASEELTPLRKQTRFVDDLARATEVLARELEQLIGASFMYQQIANYSFPTHP